MEIYIAILLVVGLVGIIGVVNSVRFSRWALLALYFPAFLALVLPAAYRWQTGWDWESYDAMVAAAPAASLGSNSGDILFDLVLRFAALQRVSIYAICAVVIVGGFFLIASRWCPTTAHMSIALAFFLWYGYYGAWSTIRQGVAIVFLSAAMLTSRSKTKWLCLVTAALFHRSALLPVALYLLYTLVWPPSSAGTKGKWLAIMGGGAAAILSRLMSPQVAAYFLDSSSGFFGAARIHSLASNSFFIEPYPLFAGRMVEIWITILVLGRIGKAGLPDVAQASMTWRLYNLQIVHLLTYLLCSPITFIAEREVLFFDYIHCLALAYALVIWGVNVTEQKRLGWLRILNRRNCIVSMAVFVMSLGYIANRYANILSADSRDPSEITHHDRFIPYRTGP